jgi:hypothetical protein
MKNKYLLTFVIFFSISNIMANDWKWKIHAGSSLNDGSEVAIDQNNNIYLFGGFEGNKFYFGNDTLLSNNGTEFISKMDENGNLIWSKQIRNTSSITCFRTSFIEIDNQSNSIFIGGSFCGQLYIFGHSASSFSNLETGYIVRLDLDGNFQWLKTVNCNGMVEFNCCTHDNFSNLFIAGYVQDSAYFDSHNIPAGSFIAKYDSTGNCTLVKSICTIGAFPSLPYIDIKCIKTINNSIYVAGEEYNDTTIIDTLIFAHPDKYGNIIGKYDGNGNRIWMNEQVSEVTEIFHGNMGLDKDENIYVTGYFIDTLTIKDTNYTILPTGQDYFLSKYDRDGNFIWFKQGHGKNNWATNLICDSTGDFYVTGGFSDTTQFGNYTLTALGSQDMFLARFDRDGNCYGVKSIPKSYGGALTVDNNLNATVITYFLNQIIVDGQHYSSYGQYDFMLTQSDKITDVYSIERKRSNELLIYANPNTGKCNIKIPDYFNNSTSELQLKIYDNTGKEIKSYSVSMIDEVLKLNIENEAKGNYVVTLSDGHEIYTGKIIFE